ncbi:MAG TPA: polysaccharide pyruvyl transferase family protein [bacterium]|nr:polysaccharide pyruvyl transferase family protein [bacterium]
MPTLAVFNLDALVELIMVLIIKLAKYPRLLKILGLASRVSHYEPGKPLRILIVGYNGARNTGADVRVEAMIRQFYHVLGKDNVHIGLLSIDPAHSKNYYHPPTEIIRLDTVFFKDVLRACSEYHLAILSEGSCFKSKFANALTTLFMGAAGIMHAQNKPCLAYGSETGKMDWLLTKFVMAYARSAYIISRTEPSYQATSKLGFEGGVGTDTAWMFEPSPPDRGRELLMKQGWDGQQPVAGFAVINPFWWPVRPSIIKLLTMKLTGKGKENHYNRFYFFTTSQERSDKFAAYISAVAVAAQEFCAKHKVFPIIIGMERLDMAANRILQEKLGRHVPIYCSSDYNGYDLTAVLHQLSLLVTSRYHARVLSMTVGVPSIGISMDERLENLMTESGHVADYYLSTDDVKLGEHLSEAMEMLWSHREQVKKEILATLPGYLEKMAGMADQLKGFIARWYPQFPLRPKPRDWRENLPALPGHLTRGIGV